MSGFVFLPVGVTATCPVHYIWDHPHSGLPAPAGVAVSADAEGVVEVALAADSRSYTMKGVVPGTVNVTVSAGDKKDVMAVQVGEPSLKSLAAPAAEVVYDEPTVVAGRPTVPGAAGPVGNKSAEIEPSRVGPGPAVEHGAESGADHATFEQATFEHATFKS